MDDNKENLPPLDTEKKAQYNPDEPYEYNGFGD